MHRVVILGGGFGGGAAAVDLARSGLDVDVTVIDRTTVTFLGAELPFVVIGERTPDDAARTAAALVRAGIRFIKGAVEEIDVAARAVRTSAGTVEYDSLIIALGSDYDWDATPGSADAYSFYDVDTAQRLRDRLEDFAGGSIVVAVAGSPIKCPPGPFEAAMVLDWWLQQRGLRTASKLHVAFPEPAPLAVAGPEASARMAAELASRGIALHPGVSVVSVDTAGVHLSDGTVLEADVPVIVPIHRPPDVVADLVGPSGWIDVDPSTLETSVDDVFAIGDVNRLPIGDKALPKAGVFAAGEGRTVAAVIQARLTGGPPPPPYDGAGRCFIAFSGTTGAEVGGVFLAPGGPDVELGEPGEDGMAQKERFAARWKAFEV
jgi:sulfide:quinone oxidoreductase